MLRDWLDNLGWLPKYHRSSTSVNFLVITITSWPTFHDHICRGTQWVLKISVKLFSFWEDYSWVFKQNRKSSSSGGLLWMFSSKQSYIEFLYGGMKNEWQKYVALKAQKRALRVLPGLCRGVFEKTIFSFSFIVCRKHIHNTYTRICIHA